jgi:4-alpha-glucanotransferase
MTLERSSGILMHITSLPSRYGIGDLGEGAYAFLDFLTEAEQSLWQVLPLGPTGYGESPYQAFSAFAGNPLLISPDSLAEQGWLEPDDLADMPDFPADSVDFASVTPYKTGLFERAYQRFGERADAEAHAALDEFCTQHADWLDDFALFMALKQEHGLVEWTRWEPELIRRQPGALDVARERLAERVGFHKFLQWQFFGQWAELRQAVNAHGIGLVGDIPIFVAHDSADVWANQDLFYLDEDGQPTVIAGVPPDYFSATGQRWGNPLYRWDVMKRRGYDWWVRRVHATLEMVDSARIDHFRGFYDYWEIPADEETAVNGQWRYGPADDFFRTLQAALQTTDLPLIAEDLGDSIGPEIHELREDFDLPGMRVLQFAFTSDQRANDFLPHNYVADTVVYTGTHDNETVIGWFHNADAGTRRHVLNYTGTRGDKINWDLIRLALMSVADTAIVPMQDVLGLDDSARMNQPSVPGGNWRWRMKPDAITDQIRERLRSLTVIYERAPVKPIEVEEENSD